MNELMILKDACPWTAGTWQFSDGTQRKWNDVQNISRDIRMVTNHLLHVYRAGSTATSPPLQPDLTGVASRFCRLHNNAGNTATAR